MKFDADYFERGEELGLSCYTDYRWLPDLTIPMVAALIGHLGIRRSDLILDFGCAKGYVVKAFRYLGYQAWGTDISEYALSCADQDTAPFLSLFDSRSPLYHRNQLWGIVLAKDVLEHLTEKQLAEVLSLFAAQTKRVFAVVPLGDGERYIIPEMEKDVTHRIRQPMNWWARQFCDAGFKNVIARYEMIGIKDRWVAQYPRGNGFLTGET